jgi:hypothetical protein
MRDVITSVITALCGNKSGNCETVWGNPEPGMCLILLFFGAAKRIRTLTHALEFAGLSSDAYQSI